MERDAMMVFAKHDTAYWSQKRPSNGRDGDCRDGDKLLCNNQVWSLQDYVKDWK